MENIPPDKVSWEINLSHQRLAKKAGGYRWGWSWKIESAIDLDFHAFNTEPPTYTDPGHGALLTPPCTLWTHEDRKINGKHTRGLLVSGCENSWDKNCTHENGGMWKQNREGMIWCDTLTELDSAIDWCLDQLQQIVDRMTEAVENWLSGWYTEHWESHPSEPKIVITKQRRAPKPSSPRVRRKLTQLTTQEATK